MTNSIFSRPYNLPSLTKSKFLLLLFLLPCCVSNSVDSIAKFRNLAMESAMNDKKNHYSTEKNLLQHYERAKVEWIDSSNNVLKSYNHSERKLGPLSYIPLLSFFLPRNYRNYETIITINNGVISYVQSFYGTITLESESICHEAIFTCVTAIK